MSDRDAGNVGERVLFDAFKAFADGPALRAFLPAMMLPWLEGQRALLRWYQKVVDEEGSTHAAEEHFRSLAR